MGGCASFCKGVRVEAKEKEKPLLSVWLHYKIGEAKTLAQRTATDNVVSFKSSEPEKNQTPVLPNMH